MTEQERYEQIDIPFYKEKVAPILPPKILDFHTHTWKREHWRGEPYANGRAGARYLVTEVDYGMERLIADGKRIFPDRSYSAVCFGQPTPAAYIDACNDYLAKVGSQQEFYPLMIVGRDKIPLNKLEKDIRQGGFFGYKVFLNWLGDDYGQVKVADMIGPVEMGLANDLGLVVLLHVPRSKRLADPEVQEGVREYAKRYPNARIVLAHCGRCYHPDEMKLAIDAIQDLDNVYLDTSMVMDPTVLQIIFEKIDSSRVLFATDFPVPAMRGRRVYVMDHWVDIVLDEYPPSSFRVLSSNIHATFMVYEIILAIKRASEMVNLSSKQLYNIFYENGMAVLSHVMDGQQLEKHS